MHTMFKIESNEVGIWMKDLQNKGLSGKVDWSLSQLRLLPKAPPLMNALFY